MSHTGKLETVEEGIQHTVEVFGPSAIVDAAIRRGSPSDRVRPTRRAAPTAAAAEDRGLAVFPVGTAGESVGHDGSVHREQLAELQFGVYSDRGSGTMRYWWVNQNQTYRAEVRGNFMWSPRQNANGVRNQFYENMRAVRPGDVVFSFCDTRIKAIGLVIGVAQNGPNPTSDPPARTGPTRAGSFPFTTSRSRSKFGRRTMSTS